MPDGRAKNGGLRHPRGGRPRWEPTADVREKVFDLAGRGIPQEHIALFVGVSESTLKRRCREELHLGALKAFGAMAWTLYQLGVSGQSPECAIFWMERFAGWGDRGALPQSPVEIRYKLVESDN